ncbi:hypothetical protein D3C87_413130 [compost metagenome]
MEERNPVPRYVPLLPALALGVLISLCDEARASSFQPFRFDEAAGTLVIEGEGSPPTWTLFRESSQLSYLEFAGTVHEGRTQALNPKHPTVTRILLAQNRPGVVRLAIRGSRLPGLKPTVAAGKRGWQLRIRVATPLSSSHPIAPIAPRLEYASDPRRKHVWMGSGAFDARTGIMTLPYHGTEPSWVIETAEGNVIYAEFPASHGAPVSLLGRTRSFSPKHPFLERILVAQNRPGVVRLALRGSVPIGLSVERQRRGASWLIVARPYPLPTSSARSSSAETLVPMVEPTSMPTPVPTPMMIASPGPLPEPVPTPEPSSREASLAWPPPRVSVTHGLVTENVGFEAQNLRVDDVSGVALDWEPSWDAWSLPLRFGQQSYQFGNADYPGVLHRRQVTEAAIALARRYHAGNLHFTTRLGYSGRWAAVSSSTQAPSQPAPSLLWFSPALNFHGIDLGQRVEAPILPWLGLELDLGLSPYVFAEAQGLSLPWLSRVSIAPSVTLGPGRGYHLGAFVETTFDPARLGGDFHQLQAGGRLRFDFGPLGRDAEVKK